MTDLYTLDGRFIMSCPPAVLASASHTEADEQSLNALGHHRKRKEQMEMAVDEFTQNLAEICHDLPYAHQMKIGGNKETYNAKMIEAESQKQEVKSTKSLKKMRADRDFDF